MEKRNLRIKRPYTIALCMTIILISIADPVPKGIGVVEIILLTFFLWSCLKYAGNTILTGRLFSSRVLLLLLIFLAIVFLSSIRYLFSEDFDFIFFVRDLGPLLILLLAFPVAGNIQKIGDLHLINLAMLVGTFLISLSVFLAVCKAGAFADPSGCIAAVRLDLRYSYKNAFQPMFICGLAVALAELADSSRGKRVLLNFLILFFLAAILLTFTRSLQIGAIVTLGAYFILARRISLSSLFTLKGCFPRFVLFSATVILIIVLGEFIKLEVERFQSVSMEHPGVIKRLAEQHNALKAFSTSPYLGKGPGYVIKTYLPEFGLDREKSYSHNFITYILLHYGLFGLVCLLAVVFESARVFYVKLKEAGNRSIRIICTTWLISFFGIFSYIQFQAVYKSFSFFLYLALFVGVSARLKSVRYYDKVQ